MRNIATCMASRPDMENRIEPYTYRARGNYPAVRLDYSNSDQTPDDSRPQQIRIIWKSDTLKHVCKSSWISI